MQGFGILFAVILLGVGLFLNTAVLLYFAVRCLQGLLRMRKGRKAQRLLFLPRPATARSL